MLEPYQIAVQIAYGPIQGMMSSPEIKACAVGLVPLVGMRKSGWIALPMEVVVFGKAS